MDAVHVQLFNSKKPTNLLGSLKKAGNAVVFRPLIAFTPGLTYTVWQGKKQIGQISVLANKRQTPPQLVAIYPGMDTLPENLLKVYFRFSKPMRVGQSLQHIKLLNSKGDTLLNTFLDLQPELWDTTATVLTLWLDPGRIKRDLAPNLRMGNPLKQGEQYRLLISGKFQDAQGIPLAKDHQKQFTVGKRDEIAPDIGTWLLNFVKAGTSGKLIINTVEPLDHFLLQESVSVLNSEGDIVNGRIHFSVNDANWQFTPAQPWKAGNYTLAVNARLEDLAGNNLNRLFDRDITKNAKRNEVVYKRMFTVK